MSYMWKEFNIKTFPAETAVFYDGIFKPELSTLTNTDINKNYDLPVHIIYCGEITGENELKININVPNQPVFLSVNIKNNLPAFLNIFIKNTGKNSEFRGQIMLNNFSNFTFNCDAVHGGPDTTILVHTKLLAETNSFSKLSGTAIIEKNSENTDSDITFSALAEKSAKIQFLPAQRISSVPQNAGHSASVFHPTEPQIQFLRQAGLSGAEVNIAMRDAFMNNFPLF